MLTYPQISPIALQVGPVAIHWYGVMYLIGFIASYLLLRYRAAKSDFQAPISKEQVGDLIFYAALGVVLGGRVGYILFYNFAEFLNNPLILLKVWQGGMSFHGGFLGVLIASWWYGRTVGASCLQITDFLAPTVPLGLLTGRIGNFINGELWGRATDVPWAMVFPHVDALPRHPSMLYEAVLEGVVMWCILWFYSAKKRPSNAVSGLFLLSYGCFRFMVEFVREPDEHIGFIALDWLTMGHMLTIPMIVFGVIMLTMAYCKTN